MADNIWEMTLQRLDSTMDALGLKKGLQKYLREPRKIIDVKIPVKMDNGTIEIFKGYRVQHVLFKGCQKRKRQNI